MKHVKRRLQLVFLSVLVLVFTIPHSFLTAQNETIESRIREVIKERVDKYGKSFGIVVGIINENGNKIISYGKLSKDGPEVDGDTVFEICSVTKVFTAILLADMVERGEVGLNDPIDKYLPDSVKVPTWNGKKITLLHLATHTSGLPNTPQVYSPRDDKPGYVDFSVDQLYDFLSNYTLTREIGSKYQYSNLGMGLLGHVLSLRTGEPCRTLIIERICQPLGMKSSRFELSPVLQSRLAQGQYLDGQVAHKHQIPPLLSGAGGLRSTANDMLKFLAANIGLLKSPLYTAMQKTHTGQKSIKGDEFKIGLAWFVIREDDLHILLHGGERPGYRSFIGFDPQKKTGVVVLANSAQIIMDIGFFALTNELKVFKLGAYKEPEMVPVDPAVYDDYVGQYQVTPTFIISITKENNRLFGQGTAQPRFELFPESGTKFFLKAVRAKITFVKDSKGNVIKLIVHSADGEEVGIKIK
jgi:D-alanyl-D-alanine-carboxypeptidase/D-alanyl-D-alanine-endopeptidase